MERENSQKAAQAQIYEGIFTGILLAVTGLFAAWLTSGLATLAVVVIAVFLFVVIKVKTYRFVGNVIFWYENLLDTIPFPLSITDKDMNWTFINKPVESMLGIKRSEVIGKHCSNWGAGICKTPKCGVTCLKGGHNRTTFEQMGLNFQVDVAYLFDRNGEQAGHIEIVQDITKLIEMQKAESKLAAEMSKLVEDINNVCSVFVKDIETIFGDIHIMSQRSSEQSQAVGELLSSIMDISNQIDANSRYSAEAADLSETVRADAEEANRQMSEMTQAVHEISEAAKAIEKIIKVIDDIAYQTNILALNAAVEAARAGQYGKGFAVVAEEVRNLAGKSAEAAKDTSRLITNSIEKTDLGQSISADTAASLDKIIERIQMSNEIIARIAESSSSQDAVLKRIQAGVENVSQIVRQNSDAARQSAAATEGLSADTQQLRNLLAAFDSGRSNAR
ncbi:MAG: methyl-accepting chemotaxis protein [Synergistaceae bacterium]|nr:methyl-accepting chemotaxis protein [Synergistaceae bacterium]